MTQSTADLMIGSEAIRPIVGPLLLAAAVLNLLAATVLYRRVFRPLYGRWWSAFRRFGTPVPSVLEGERVQRAWGVLSALMFFTAWWLTRPS